MSYSSFRAVGSLSRLFASRAGASIALPRSYVPIRCAVGASTSQRQQPSSATPLTDGGLAVVALGGNALLKRGDDPKDTASQQRNAAAAAASVARLVHESRMRVVVTHGNGPQVGLLALQDPDASLDVLDAESEGQIGYLLESALDNALPGRDIVTLLTQVVVDPSDPAFQHPTKFIGPTYSREEAERLAAAKGWSIAEDSKGWRRVVASPTPLDIVESRAIELLVRADVIAIACGGGGIPVTAASSGGGARRGVEAVVDKDLASAVLAAKLRADWLLMLTDEPCVWDPRRWPGAREPLPSPISASDIERLRFPEGSMGPKVRAAVQFVRSGGRRAGIGSLEAAAEVVRGQAGTVVVPD